MLRGRWLWALLSARCAHALVAPPTTCRRWLVPHAPRCPPVFSCGTPNDKDGNLTLEQLGHMLADVRLDYRTTGELEQPQVCRNMLATRLSDLHLHRCRIGPSTLPGDSGMGLFATRSIQAGELITLYPGDALLYWADGNRDPQNGQICSGVIFGAHVSQAERDVHHVTSNSARRYELEASATISCVGDPLRDSDPSYLGHFANDGSMCLALADAETYDAQSKAAANADHVSLEGCELATQATRAIAAGEEILVSYGAGHWLTHAGFDAPVQDALRTTRGERKGRADKTARRANHSRKKKKTTTPARGFGRAGPIAMQQLTAGGQFEDRPMKDINKSGPSEARVAKVKDLMARMEAEGKIGAASAMVAAKRAEMAGAPKMDAVIEQEHREEIEQAQAVAASMMRSGNVDGALEALRVVQPWLCTVTELGSSVLLDLAMSLDAKHDPEASTIFASLSRSPNSDVRAMAKMMGSVDESEGILKF